MLQPGLEDESQCRGYFVCKVFQKNPDGRLSGPAALFRSKFKRSFLTPSPLLVLHFRIVITVLVHAWEARVKALLNWLLDKVALILGSVQAMSSDFKGKTPLLSHLLDFMNECHFCGVLPLDTVSLAYML